MKIRFYSKKIFALAILSIMIALCLAGCAAKDEQATPAPTLMEATEKVEETTAVPQKTEETVEETINPAAEPEKEVFETVNFSVNYNPIYTEDFESGESLFTGRGAVKVEIVTDYAYQGSNSLLVTGRKETWNGPIINVSDIMTVEKRFKIEAWVSQNGSDTPVKINCTIQQNENNYLGGGFAVAKEGEWAKVDGIVTIPPGTTSIQLFFETNYNEAPKLEDLADIYIDQITVSEVTTTGSAVDLQSLYEVHEDYFSVGIGVTPYDIQASERAEVVLRHFNSITMGNEMKPDYILDYTTCSSDPAKYDLAPAIHTRNLEIGLQFAKENGIKLRGHTLVWHAQTPTWFFKENYSKSSDAPNVSRETMLARMESYIKQVLTYCQENYPGVVYCYDVVNEAIETGDGDPNGIRVKNNLWYETIGADYVEMAFTFARKYAEPEMKLFYNDYNCFYRTKLLQIYNMASALKEKGLIDGIGMQGHIGMADPVITDYQYAITKFGELDLEIQITELDIGLSENSDEELNKLGSRYKRLMTMFRYVDENELANITNVTVWGLTDDGSWLNDITGAKYPLLFDMYLQPKAAFYGFAMDDSVPSFQSK